MTSTSIPPGGGTKQADMRNGTRYAAVPTELKRLRQWCVYNLVPKANEPGKFDKPPLNARTGRLASVNDPTTFSAFDVAYAA